jgi:hypothetical protein
MRRQVTGWKAVFVNKGVTKRIIGLSKDESDAILDYLNVCRMTSSLFFFLKKGSRTTHIVRTLTIIPETLP